MENSVIRYFILFTISLTICYILFTPSILNSVTGLDENVFVQLYHPNLQTMQSLVDSDISFIKLIFVSLSVHIRLPQDIESSLVDMLFAYKYGKVYAFGISVIIHTLSEIILFSVMYSLSKILSSFIPKLQQIHAFSSRFWPYFSNVTLFSIFVPILPIRICCALFGLIGLPIFAYALAQLLSVLPQTYLNMNLGERMTEVESIRFESDIVFLVLLLFALGSSLTITITFTIKNFFEDKLDKNE
ncbi:hypothetical protein EDI_201780 [Entamoeba dispar SAW760]|uniref:SNARE associated Golgi protein n=1 Tax=Entamoeba dispar (strain ATCC PRA-260 / SAW760) TaxID=370354 RepID=B0ETX3_ENTDS|nr:uncharacterized protein EDI_201780 [Entamoeba dispar SAW760]EDR22061.1 hypothetical protein EDI_201780 [Entamoeba dispar SAW760]|eukprot:EDR22061.1 hypothetical protein EDI_201780 [Entamoeba dispar SAW760]